MKYRRLGRSNLLVSELCLGTMMFGDQTDAKESGRIIAHCKAQGVNFIDTADQYSLGKSEAIVGAAIRKQRHDWILATKLGNKMSETHNQSHYSRKWIIEETEASLKRLGTDFIDIHYLHRDFAGENLEEAVQSMGALIQSGKIRYFGVSNFRGWRIAEIVRLCDQMNVPRPVVCQPYYNLLNRMPEVEILPACGNYGLGVVPYSPIARGVLTGKYMAGVKPPKGSRAARGDKRMLQTEWRDESLHIAHTLKAHTDKRGIELLQFAVAWVLANPFVSSVIAGPRTLDQIKPYFGALDVAWGKDDEALCDSLVPPGHPSTPGYTDPMYPLIGRNV